MWWPFHKHLYLGPEVFGYNLILKKSTTNYICGCGARIEVLPDGEILMSWLENGKISFNSLVAIPDGAKVTRKFVKHFSIVTTEEIRESEIYSNIPKK